MITQDQIDFFHNFGFIKFPGLFKDDIGWITEEFHQAFANANIVHNEQTPSNLDPFIDKTAKLASLLYDERIETICTALLGADFNYMNSDGKIFAADTLWHRDGLIQDDYKFIKIGFYLDSVNSQNGAIRVIPGSHRLKDQYSQSLGPGSFMNDVRSADGLYWGMPGRDIPAHTIDSEPGDMLIFAHQLLHSSWGGGKNRRMFAISLCERFREQDMELLAKFMSFSPSRYGDLLVQGAVTEQGKKHLEQGLAYFDTHGSG